MITAAACLLVFVGIIFLLLSIGCAMVFEENNEHKYSGICLVFATISLVSIFIAGYLSHA